MNMKSKSPSAIKRMLESRIKVYQQIIDALDGKSVIDWTLGEADAYTKILAECGLHVASKSKIERDGLELKQGVKPLGTRYYGSPISGSYPVYLVECHTKAKSNGR